MPNPRKQDRELDALYATLPRLDCRGFCHDSCGPIDMSVREHARIVEQARKPVTCGKGAACSMLTADRRCGVYDIRPMICRVWGLTRRMRCPYGCEPERWLSNREVVRVLLEAERIGGSPRGDRQQRMAERILDSLSEEDLAAAALRLIGEPATLDGRLATLHRTGVRAPYETPGLPVGATSMAYPKKKP